MEEVFKLSTYGMYEAFGFIAGRTDDSPVAIGCDDLERFLTSKDKPKTEWPDDITEYDLSSPVFQPGEVTLVGTMYATGFADYQQKHSALWAILSAPDELELEAIEIQRAFKVFYKSNPIHKRLTNMDDGEIIVQLSLVFQVFDNADYTPPAYPNIFTNEFTSEFQ